MDTLVRASLCNVKHGGTEECLWWRRINITVHNHVIRHGIRAMLANLPLHMVQVMCHGVVHNRQTIIV